MDLAQAAAQLERELKPLMGHGLTVVHSRGIQVAFERETEESFLRRQLTTGYRDEDLYVSAKVGIIPAGGGKFDLKLQNGPKEVDTLKSLGVSFRRSTAPSLEKAVETTIKWFRMNAGKLKDGTKTAGNLVLRVAGRFG